MLTPHRRDSLIEFMKSMLNHSFVLDALKETGADTFEHFEQLIDEHRDLHGANEANFFGISNVDPSIIATLATPRSNGSAPNQVSRLQMLVPTVKTFFTRLPLRMAFEAYDTKYSVTSRKHVCISFNEIRHILNLSQIMAMCPGLTREEALQAISGEIVHSSEENDEEEEDDDEITPGRIRKLSMDSASHFFKDIDDKFRGPTLITFDADQTLYSDGANFESNPRLANYIYLLLKKNVHVAIVTAAGYEYQTAKYEFRLSGLLNFFKQKKLELDRCMNFYVFGGECNYLLQLGDDYHLHPVRESGPGGWLTSTRFLGDSPGNWSDECISNLLDTAECIFNKSVREQRLIARVIRKKRAVGLVPADHELISRESLDETVLRVHDALQRSNISIPFCAFNGGSDCWVDAGNKRVGVQILQAYLDVPPVKTLHIGDQFLNTGNDYAARDSCPCLWITKPEETTYILKLILRMAGVEQVNALPIVHEEVRGPGEKSSCKVDFNQVAKRSSGENVKMDVYTGEIIISTPS